MVKITKAISLALIFSVFLGSRSFAEVSLKEDVSTSGNRGSVSFLVRASEILLKTDSLSQAQRSDSIRVAKADSLKIFKSLTTPIALNKLFQGNKDSILLRTANLQSNVSLQQIVKGQAGVYVQEVNGEPGTYQSMTIRGIASPIFENKAIYDVQPAVYINGLPLIRDNPFAFDIQKYDFNKIGTATNLLSTIDISDIESIEVIKDPTLLAKLGPNAVNGAIYITTKQAKPGKWSIDLNSYFGMAPAETPSTINGSVVNNFRKPFYDKYAKPEDYANISPYLRDSTNSVYFGKADWSSLYYKSVPVFSGDIGIAGGSERANFRFFGSATQSASSGDRTALNRYKSTFSINMAPVSWLVVSSFVDATKLDRKRNRNFRDRFAEISSFVPDLTNPLSPNADNYQIFLTEYEKSIDDNSNSLLRGNFSLNMDFKRLKFVSSILFDFNQAIRDVFYPSTLMSGVNYISNYSGYNRRFSFNNSLQYAYRLNKRHRFDFELGQSTQSDVVKYNYSKSFNGLSDFIKIVEVNGNSNSSNFLLNDNFYSNRFTDKQQFGLFSIYGFAKYYYRNVFTLSALLRRDGTSTGQPDSRWINSPAFSADWNLKKHFFQKSSKLNNLAVKLSYAKLLRTFSDDRFSAGPQYRTEVAWEQEPSIAVVNGSLPVTSPYQSGWVGYGITLPYANRLSFDLNTSFFKNRLTAAISFYNRDDKNQLLEIPINAESGFSSIFKNGMWVNNKGIDLLLGGQLLKRKKKGFIWDANLNVNFNKNTLKALPDNLNELIIGDNKLVVGQSIGKYWLYQNQGLYASESEIPVDPVSNEKLSFNGLELHAGDPKWLDVNGDYNINDDDKVLIGNRLAKLVGGFVNNFKLGAFNANFQLVYAVGQKAINGFAATKYDFVNQESVNDLASIKEVTFWQSSDKELVYPLYNTWSEVIPYREDQDLFLEDASYLKLRSASLGYDLTKSSLFAKAKKIRSFLVYVTASNIWTLTKFSGFDPELINFNGRYDGRNIGIQQTYTLGFRMNL